MSEIKQSASGGLGLFVGLAVSFSVLKLTGVIGWNWWWVLLPLWISVIAGLVVAYLDRNQR